MKIQVNDRASYQITHREITDEGFLRVPGRVARTGIQQYLAKELGLEGDPMRIVRVYRPAEEVFSADSLATYHSAVLTNDHPAGLVTAATYKQLTVGDVSSAGRQDGDYVVCDLVFKDQAAIRAILDGKCELSAGYTAEYVAEPGMTADGEPYDYVQRNIKINHVAVVLKGRAGPIAKLFDNHTGGNTMPVLITTDSGRSVDVADPANAQVVADSYDRLLKRATDAEAKVEKVQAIADKAAEDLTEARKASSDEAITARVTIIGTTQAAARKVAGDTFTSDSLDPVEIKRAALVVARPKVAWAEKSAAYVEAAFDAEMEKEKDEDETDENGNKKPKTTGDTSTLLAQLAQLAKDASTVTQTTDAAKPTHYEASKARLRDGWKGTVNQKGA